MRQKRTHAAPTTTALERLKEFAPDGPPFLGLMLDLPTVQALALGVVNSRAEVCARQALAAYEHHTLKAKGA
jgi:hypothetical protein